MLKHLKYLKYLALVAELLEGIKSAKRAQAAASETPLSINGTRGTLRISWTPGDEYSI